MVFARRLRAVAPANLADSPRDVAVALTWFFPAINVALMVFPLMLLTRHRKTMSASVL